MAAPKLGFFEKIANMSGVVYRHHASHFPRRWDIFKKVLEREVRPPKMSDWPVIQKDFKTVVKYVENKEYKALSVRVCFLSALIVCDARLRSFETALVFEI